MVEEAEVFRGAHGALGEEQRIADRHAHVGGAELRLDGAVLELDHRVDDRLGMLHDGDAVGLDVEEPPRLDHLEPFVDQGRGVDRDLGAHRPLGVAQGLFDGHRGELLALQVAQRAAAARDDEAAQGRPFACEALEDGRMLRVDRQDRRTAFARQRHHVCAGDDERLLVRQRQLLARFDRSDGGGEPRIAHQGVDDHLRVARRGDLRHGLLTREDLRVGVGEGVAQRFVEARVGDDDRRGVEGARLLGQPPPVAVSRQHDGFEAVGIFAYDVERLLADGSRGSQNGQSLFHVGSERCLRHQKTMYPSGSIARPRCQSSNSKSAAPSSVAAVWPSSSPARTACPVETSGCERFL